jgi:N-acetylglucosaminyldiphosphoundecaprenol N-acetyl-beta-D-mannosaminyltransferase
MASHDVSEGDSHEASSQTPRRRASLLGCRIDALTFAETLVEVDRLIQARTPVQHCVINASKIVLMRKDVRLREIVSHCALVSADGQAVVWASRMLGEVLPERVTGIDLFLALLGMAENRGYGVYFLGATRSVVEASVARARAEYPRLRVSGWRDGYFRKEDTDMVVRRVRDARPDILFVGMPSPRKEYWLADNLGRLEVPFSMGIGGSLDVYAGRVKRAPNWMQRVGLEWLFRFSQEPRRMWRRYLLGNTAFLRLVLSEWVRRVRVSDKEGGGYSEGPRRGMR